MKILILFYCQLHLNQPYIISNFYHLHLHQFTVLLTLNIFYDILLKSDVSSLNPFGIKTRIKGILSGSGTKKALLAE